MYYGHCMYDSQGMLVCRRRQHVSIVELFADPVQDNTKLVDVTALLQGKTYIFQDDRTNMYFQVGRFVPGDAIMDFMKQTNGSGYVTLLPSGNGTVKLVLNGNEYISCDNTYVFKTQVPDTNSTWRVFANMTTKKFYFNNVVQFTMYMYPTGEGHVALDTLDSGNIQSFGAFAIVPGPGASPNPLEKPASPSPAGPGPSPSACAPTPKEQIQVTMAFLRDITKDMFGQTFIFRDEREHKVFQKGRFSGSGQAIMDVYKNSKREGFVYVEPAHGIDDSAAHLVIQKKEFLSSDGTFAVKSTIPDVHATWRIYKHNVTNKLYFNNVATNGLFMYAAGNGVVGMDQLESTNVASYGGFIAFP